MEYLEKRSGERNVDSRIQVQLEEDGGGSTRQSWMETIMCFVAYMYMFPRERQGISQVQRSAKQQTAGNRSPQQEGYGAVLLSKTRFSVTYRKCDHRRQPRRGRWGPDFQYLACMGPSVCWISNRLTIVFFQNFCTYKLNITRC